MNMISQMLIRPYSLKDEAAVVALWVKCNMTRAWNNPQRDIARKLKVNPEWFLVGEIIGQVVAMAMGGYEGHRGWVNYLAVHPEHQKKGLGRLMMTAIEEKLKAAGCPKINLQVRRGNDGALAFYARIGDKTDDVVSLGKRLVED